MAFLEVERLSKHFGGLPAVDGVTFTVNEGEILGLIGPNGAGKTTTFNLISARFRPTSGTVRLEGGELQGLRADQISAHGVARTFQGTRIFPKLTVEENVLTAVVARKRVGFWSGWLGLGSARRAEEKARAEALEALRFVGIEPLRQERAGNLAYAHQSLLGIGLALALKPRLLLLDEPFAGMNPEETLQGVQMVRRIRDRGITVVLVEHDVAAVMSLCDRIVVLNHGLKIAEGTPAEIKVHPEVVTAYLGEVAHA